MVRARWRKLVFGLRVKRQLKGSFYNECILLIPGVPLGFRHSDLPSRSGEGVWMGNIA